MAQQDYVIRYAPLFNTLQPIDVQALIDQVRDPWYNQTLIQVGDVLVAGIPGCAELPIMDGAILIGH